MLGAGEGQGPTTCGIMIFLWGNVARETKASDRLHEINGVSDRFEGLASRKVAPLSQAHVRGW